MGQGKYFGGLVEYALLMGGIDKRYGEEISSQGIAARYRHSRDFRQPWWNHTQFPVSLTLFPYPIPNIPYSLSFDCG